MRISNLGWFIIRLPVIVLAMYVMRDVPVWQSIPLYFIVWFLGIMEGHYATAET